MNQPAAALNSKALGGVSGGQKRRSQESLGSFAESAESSWGSSDPMKAAEIKFVIHAPIQNVTTRGWKVNESIVILFGKNR